MLIGRANNWLPFVLRDSQMLNQLEKKKEEKIDEKIACTRVRLWSCTAMDVETRAAIHESGDTRLAINLLGEVEANSIDDDRRTAPDNREFVIDRES